MIIGKLENSRRCPHETTTCTGIDDLYLFCQVCRRIILVSPRVRIPLKDRLTRELPRPRQDAFSQFEDQHLEFD
jgi:hypothetical protein